MTDLFSPSLIATRLRAIAAATLPLQVYAQTLLQQPIVGLDGVPTLTSDLTAAHEAAQASLIDLMPQACIAGTDALGFANQMLGYYPKLTQDALTIDGGGAASATAATSFASGLRNLNETIKTAVSDLDKLGDGAAKLAADAKQVAAALAADAQAAAGDQDISALQEQVTTIMQAIDANCQTIATGLDGVTKDAVKVGIAAYNAEDEPAGLLKAFVGTILSAATKSEEVRAAEDSAFANINKLGALYGDLSSVLFSAAVVQTASASAVMFASMASRVQTAAENASIAWSALAGGFEGLAKLLSTGQAPAHPLAPQLADSEAGWQTLQTNAQKLQQMPLLPVSVIDWDGAIAAPAAA